MVTQFIKFVGVGGINTAITYILYLLLLYFIDYKTAYTLTYISGIVLSYWLNLTYVFGQKGSKRKIILYPIVYIVQYIFGIFILYIAIEKLHIPKEIAPILVVVFSIPFTFILTKKILSEENE